MSHERPPLVSFSNNQERASLFNQQDSDNEDDKDDEVDDYDSYEDMPPRRRGGRRRKVSGGRRRRRRRTGAAKGGHRVVRGRISLKIKGLGIRKVPSSKLIKFIAKSKLISAARKVYAGEIGRKGSRRRRRKKGGARRKSTSTRRRGAAGRFI